MTGHPTTRHALPQSIAEAKRTAAPPTHAAAITFDTLPDSAYLRESQLVQSPKRPDVAAPLPFSGNTLWRKVKAREFPQPVKLGPRITAWKVGDVRAWLESQTVTA